MTKHEIIAGLQALGELAREDNRVIDIAIYGGAAIVLAWNFRVATKDVDAVVMNAQDGEFLRAAVAKVAAAKGFAPDWLNDAVKGFLHQKQDLQELPLFSGHENCGIRVFTPTAEYMLAMKCMAMRLGEGSQDAADIRSLLATLKIQTLDAAMDIVARYYPEEMIAPRVRFGLEELIEQAKAP